MKFVKNTNSNNLLVHKSFLYSREKPPKNEKTIWKCVESKNCMCRARVHTVDEEISKVLNVHPTHRISGKQIFS